MGTTYTIKTTQSHKHLKSSVDARLAAIEQIFSTWKPDSELSILNQAKPNEWVLVSDELFYLLSTSKHLYQQTQGYFDPGIGNLIDLWGFGSTVVEHKPSRSVVKEQIVDNSIQYLELQNNRVRKLTDFKLNLSAIAKGYALDEVAKLMLDKNYLIEIGGEVLASGLNINNQNWRIGIENPNNLNPISIALNNEAIATSGNYRNYFIWEGERYMHILSPKTGLPAKSDLTSVSVIHDETMLADAYATAMMAMGSRRASEFAKKMDLSVLLILDQAHDNKIVRINL